MQVVVGAGEGGAVAILVPLAAVADPGGGEVVEEGLALAGHVERGHARRVGDAAGADGEVGCRAVVAHRRGRVAEGERVVEFEDRGRQRHAFGAHGGREELAVAEGGGGGAVRESRRTLRAAPGGPVGGFGLVVVGLVADADFGLRVQVAGCQGGEARVLAAGVDADVALAVFEQKWFRGSGLRDCEFGTLVVNLGEMDGPIATVDQQLARNALRSWLVVRRHRTTGRCDPDVCNGYHARHCNKSEHGQERGMEAGCIHTRRTWYEPGDCAIDRKFDRVSSDIWI